MGVNIKVKLETLVCQSDQVKTKFCVARNPDTGVLYGKPGKTIHVIPHHIFHDGVKVHLTEHFKDCIGEPVIEFPKSGARITIMYPIINLEWAYMITKGEKEVPYYPCIFAINCYDGLVTPRIVVGVYKNEAQYSGALSTDYFRLRAIDHTPREISTGVANILDYTQGDFKKMWKKNTDILSRIHSSPLNASADELIQKLTYAHTMLSTQQKEKFTTMWDSITTGKTWLHYWEAMTYILSDRVESRMRFGAISVK